RRRGESPGVLPLANISASRMSKRKSGGALLAFGLLRLNQRRTNGDQRSFNMKIICLEPEN
ncbi:MAG: hypothetical protein WA366_20830, partial [Pseudolabrys sp.]